MNDDLRRWWASDEDVSAPAAAFLVTLGLVGVFIIASSAIELILRVRGI